MSRIAIISDIHGNMDALQVVLSDAQRQGVSRFLVCGDIAGYYYDTAIVWQTLTRYDIIMCRGNHEQILSEWVDGDRKQREIIRRKYGSSYRLAHEEMKPEDLSALLALPHPAVAKIDNIRFLISHGAPWDENVYIYPDKIDESLQKLEDYLTHYDVICMGHTHYQMSFMHKGLHIINPGSVGQPRSGREHDQSLQSRAQWALYNTDDRSCALMTSFYDPSRICAQIDLYDPDLPHLKKVLKRQETPV